MTIDPGARQDLKPWTAFTRHQDIPDWILSAYIESYRGPHTDEPGTPTGPIDLTVPAAIVSPGMLSAHYRLGEHRPAGESRVAVYGPDDPAGFGPALQVVTEHGSMLMDSVTVLLHRLGVAYTAIMTPVFEVRRNAAGDLVRVEPKGSAASPYTGEAWIHVQLSPSVDSKGLVEVERLLPKVLSDVQQVASDASGLISALCDLATKVDENTGGRFTAPDRDDAAALLRWL